jgi:hypothetical protein
MDQADPAEVEQALQHYRGLIARMTPEQRQRLRESYREDEAVADGDPSPDHKP